MRLIPSIRFTTNYTSLRGWKYQRGYKLLKPGDILLTIDHHKLTTILVPGLFSHAAMCVAKGDEWEVSEMTNTDYTYSCFFDICKESDRVVIMRCKDFDEEYTKKVVNKCKSFKGTKYDVEFNLGIKALYCSELIYHSDFEHRLHVSLEDIASIGREYISPTGLFKAKNVDVVWDSDTEKENVRA